MGGVCNWSEVPTDILNLLSRRLHSVNDCLNFSYVCKSWHPAVPADSLIPRPPLLMLPDTRTKEEEKEEEEEDEKQCEREQHQRGFLGLIQGPSGEFINEVFEVQLPEMFRSRCIGSKGNWVVTIDMELRVHILNLFTRVQFDLPSASGLRPPAGHVLKSKKQHRELFFSKVVLSSAPNCRSNWNTSKCVAMGIHDRSTELWNARLGETSWTKVQGVNNVQDVIYYKENFYAINRANELFVCDFSCCPLKATQISNKHAVVPRRATHKRYLVELLGELALVLRIAKAKCTEDRMYFVTTYFAVCTFDFSTGRWIHRTNLGCCSLFLGFNTSVSLVASPSSTFRGNCIYFSEDHHLDYYRVLRGGFRTERSRTIVDGGHDMGVFDMRNGKVQRILNDDLVVTSCYSPPVWIIPDFY